MLIFWAKAASLQSLLEPGGDTVSTRVWKLKLRAGVRDLVKNAEKTQTPTLNTSTHWLHSQPRPAGPACWTCRAPS